MTSRLQPYFAVCPGGLGGALADELGALGARETREESGGVAFNGTRELGYAANLHSRIASRVLWPALAALRGEEWAWEELATVEGWFADLRSLFS